MDALIGDEVKNSILIHCLDTLMTKVDLKKLDDEENSEAKLFTG